MNCQGDRTFTDPCLDQNVLSHLLTWNICGNFRCAIQGAEQLFTQVQETTFRLAKLADERLHRLEQCLQLRQFEEQCSKVCFSSVIFFPLFYLQLHKNTKEILVKFTFKYKLRQRFGVFSKLTKKTKFVVFYFLWLPLSTHSEIK